MKGQLSLEFLLILSLSLSYLAFSLSLINQTGNLLNQKIQELSLDRMETALEFAHSSKGRFVFNIPKLPASRIAIWSEDGFGVVASCLDGEMIYRKTTIPLENIPKKICSQFLEGRLFKIENMGVMHIEGPTLS